MIRTVIVEDEENALYALQNLLQKHCPNIWVVATANTVDEAVETIAKTSPDLVFMDVELNGEHSFAIFQRLGLQPTFETIFTTAHSRYALEAIKASCLEYLLKPIDPQELVVAVQKLEEKKWSFTQQKRIELLLHNTATSVDGGKKLAIPTSDGFVFLNVSEMVFCEAESNYTYLQLLDGTRILSSRNLGWFEELLPDTHFFRCHKSFLININHIVKYSKNQGHTVEMIDGHLVDISSRKIDEFLVAITK